MSILKKPYEISIWDDVLEDGNFKEKRLAVIGTDKMVSPNRALEPTLTREVSGNKTFSFKLYEKYVEPISGKELKNPFIQYLVPERKVKLKYEDKWYDFIIKSIEEPSETGLYTYNLVDANVIELSKNGFSVVFDEKISNNLGTAKELAETALDGTQWQVESEKFVEKIEEPLVHLRVNLPKGEGKPTSITAYKIKDDNLSVNGAVASNESITIYENEEILAFYSCCKNKPYRFQFIYKADKTYSVDEKNIIDESGCQYYIDYPNIYGTYTKSNNTYGLILPSCFDLVAAPQFNNKKDNTISILAKGHRYGYSQQIKYSSLLDKYLYKYTDGSNTYWGYDKTEIIAPNLITNLVSSPEMSSTDGWVGARTSNSGSKAAAESVYGIWENRAFISIIDKWSSGNQPTTTDGYQSYIKATFSSKDSALINSGFYENRHLVTKLDTNDYYVLRLKIRKANGDYLTVKELKEWSIALYNCQYDTTNDYYNLTDNDNQDNQDSQSNQQAKIYIDIDKDKDGNKKWSYDLNTGYIAGIYKVISSLTEEELRRKKIKLVINPNFTSTESNKEIFYYIEALEFFKKYDREDGTYLTLDYSNPEDIETKLNTERILYKDEELFGKKPTEEEPSGKEPISSTDQLHTITLQDLSYNTYQPSFNDGAEKQRSITIKESNYFNILQTIAETFEAWLDIVVVRDKNIPGAIDQQIVKFKNYIGKNNYASFRYGVNLTNIVRQTDSKEIVSKLIVKDNSNQYADGGFCSIKDAGGNMTGENVLYNFDYYVSKNLLNGEELSKYLYNNMDDTSPGYYVRLGQINKQLLENSDSRRLISASKLKVDSDLLVAEQRRDAAIQQFEESAQNFEDLAKQSYISKLTEELKQNSDVRKYYENIQTAIKNKNEAIKQIDILKPQQTELQEQIFYYDSEIKDLSEQKKTLNADFYKKYFRFLQEGTWISEDYIDSEKYYVDAQATLYNSCYPKVSYTINVIEISQLPGYEYFTFDLGDITYAEDPELFGDEGRAEVVISSLTQSLDNPKKNTITVKTYKNQFQTLFQKITAATQQVQYSGGSYDKAAAMANADAYAKQEYLKNSIDDISSIIANSGNQSVSYGEQGILVQDLSAKSRQLRLVGGAILMSKENENGVLEWITGITPDGISANLITAGKINTQTIQIMAANEPTFLWDAYGINAYSYDYDDNGNISNISNDKFTRFDRFGIYGINGNKDGRSWHPASADDIMAEATFALTYEGLKVTGKNGVIAKIGKDDTNIVNITKADGRSIFRVGNDGTSEIAGWTISNEVGYNGGFYHDVGISGKPTHRIGLKIENGVEDRYGFYVKKFTEQQTDYTKPKGQVVFGVKYNGEMTATAGTIANWTIEPNRLYTQTEQYDDIPNAFGVDFFSPTVLDKGDGVIVPGADVLVVRNKVDGAKSSPFILRSSGYLECSNINARGGKIACFNITDERLSYNLKDTLGKPIIGSIERGQLKFTHGDNTSSLQPDVLQIDDTNRVGRYKGDGLYFYDSYASESINSFIGGLVNNKAGELCIYDKNNVLTPFSKLVGLIAYDIDRREPNIILSTKWRVLATSGAYDYYRYVIKTDGIYKYLYASINHNNAAPNEESEQDKIENLILSTN